MYGCGTMSHLDAPPVRTIANDDILTLRTEHLQLLLSNGQEALNSCVSHYKMILRGIFDQIPVVPQTSTGSDGQPITSLTSNYLCLQCPSTVTEADRLKHGNKKSHRFCMLPE